MIYSTNRTASLGDDITVDVNESYFGAGALMFGQECAQDELTMFEAAIKSDIDECIIGESASELQALNEGFVDNAKNKIKEIMKKFIAWLDAIMRSAIAKLTALFVRDNAKFVKIARKQIAKMKNKGKFEFSGEYADTESAISAIDGVMGSTPNINDAVDKAKAEALKEKMESLSISDFKDDKSIFKDADAKNEEAFKIINKQLNILDGLASKDMKKVKDDCNNLKKEAAKFVKKAESDLNKLKDDAKDDDRTAAQNKVDAANAFKSAAQTYVSFKLKAIKLIAKVARKAVAKAMGASPKNEGYFESEELMDAVIESAEFELDEALEEMSEGGNAEDDGLEDIDDEE